MYYVRLWSVKSVYNEGTHYPPPGQKQHLTTIPTQVGVGESLEWPRVASLNGGHF